MSYQVLQRVTGRRETRRINLPVVPWEDGCVMAATYADQIFITFDLDNPEPVWKQIAKFDIGTQGSPCLSVGDGDRVFCYFYDKTWPYIYKKEDLTWIKGVPLFATGGIRVIKHLCNGILLAGGRGKHYVARSIDNGDTWGAPQLLSDDALTHVLDIEYLGNGVVLASGAYNNGYYPLIFRSEDYGASWISPGIALPYAPEDYDYVYQIRSLGNGVVIIGTFYGYIYRSENYGISWVNTGRVAKRFMVCDIVDFGNGIFLVASETGGGGEPIRYISRSVDNGASWTDVGVLDSNGIWVSSLLDMGSGKVWAGLNTTVHRDAALHISTNYGESWSEGMDINPALFAEDTGGISSLVKFSMGKDLVKSLDEYVTITE